MRTKLFGILVFVAALISACAANPGIAPNNAVLGISTNGQRQEWKSLTGAGTVSITISNRQITITGENGAVTNVTNLTIYGWAMLGTNNLYPVLVGSGLAGVTNADGSLTLSATETGLLDGTNTWTGTNIYTILTVFSNRLYHYPQSSASAYGMYSITPSLANNKVLLLGGVSGIGNGFVVQQNASSNMVILIDPGTNGYTMFQKGNMAVGATIPTEKLHVSGNILATGTNTAARFVGDGGGLTNLSGGNNFNPTQFDTNGSSQVQIKTGAFTTNQTVFSPYLTYFDGISYGTVIEPRNNGVWAYNDVTDYWKFDSTNFTFFQPVVMEGNLTFGTNSSLNVITGNLDRVYITNTLTIKNTPLKGAFPFLVKDGVNESMYFRGGSANGSSGMSIVSIDDNGNTIQPLNLGGNPITLNGLWGDNVVVGSGTPTEKFHVFGNTKASGSNIAAAFYGGSILVTNAVTASDVNVSGRLAMSVLPPNTNNYTLDHIVTNAVNNLILRLGAVLGLANGLTAVQSTNGAMVWVLETAAGTFSVPTGNVGIGTNAPTEKLHVVGNALVTGTNMAPYFNVNNNITYAVNTNTAGTETVFYLDMTKAMQELVISNVGLAGPITFHSTNRAPGLTITLRIKQTATNSLPLTFNSGWTNFVGNLPPSALASNVWGILSISCWGGDETNVLAGYSVQPY